jgi:dolichyl-phosphate beta-glucosyltransferase
MRSISEYSTDIAVTHPKQTDTFVSLVIPVYNGQHMIVKTLNQVLDYFLRQDYSFEIIVVDDGSTDNTAEILATFGRNILVLRNEINRGKGFAVRRGVLAAHGKYVFFTDADLPFSLDPIPKFIDYLDRKEFDLVIGSRSQRECEDMAKPSLVRRVASAVFTAFVSTIVVTGVTDTQCGFKGFKKDSSQFLFSRSRIDGFAFDVEVIYLAFKANMDIKRLPVSLKNCDRTSVKLFADSVRMGLDVLRIKLNHMRGLYK